MSRVFIYRTVTGLSCGFFNPICYSDMASFFSGSTSDLPKPETDLAEWTNKIKARQKQVDADDEAQQKRLEDEIVSARRARLRRRSGMDAESHVNSLDIRMSTCLHTQHYVRNLTHAT